jgi:hypothetical protein
VSAKIHSEVTHLPKTPSLGSVSDQGAAFGFDQQLPDRGEPLLLDIDLGRNAEFLIECPFERGPTGSDGFANIRHTQRILIMRAGE